MTEPEVIAQYGDPRSTTFEKENILPFDLPYPLVYGTAMVYRSRCHRLAVDKFKGALEAVRFRGLEDRATHYGGIYAVRPIRGRVRMSSHSWGLAIDMNPQENYLGTVGRMDAGVVACFKEQGFVWGGEFHSRLDPMHFSLTGF